MNMTQGQKTAATAAANREKRAAKEQYHNELLQLMIMSLQIVLKDESISNESRLTAVKLMDELRKELRL